MDKLLNGLVRFEGVKGVGTIEVDFVPNQRVYTFIGANGVGKTKLLECLFAVLFLHSIKIKDRYWIRSSLVPFRSAKFKEVHLEVQKYVGDDTNFPYDIFSKEIEYIENHDIPLVYLAAQNRGNIQMGNHSIQKIGNYQQRIDQYLEKLISVFRQPEQFKSLNMDGNIEEWIIQRAQSANPYQSQADNRKIELDTLLDVLHQIDKRIDSQFLEISGDNRVFLKVEKQKRELTKLSSGFTSILKMAQSIIAGYSYFTNEQQISHVRGVVLIDEIESHLHNEWQVKIIPLLKKLFPNTTFLVTTHSSLVISQLAQGEAYRLARNTQGVVEAQMIDYPNNASFVDLLNDAFDVNLNKLKIERVQNHQQIEAKQALLNLVQQELSKIGDD